MEKKTYINPEMQVVVIAPQMLLAESLKTDSSHTINSQDQFLAPGFYDDDEEEDEEEDW